MRCESCGAELPQGQSTCEYCGSTWDRVVPAVAVAPHNDRDVFARIRQSPAWAERHSPSRQTRLPQMSPLTTVAPILFLVVFIMVAGFIGMMMLGMAGAVGAVGFSHMGPMGGGFALMPAFMALVPGAFIVLGIFLLAKHVKTMGAFRNAPVQSHAAIIAGKRTQVSGGGRNSSASTTYYITAEYENGRREEFSTMTHELYARVSEGDAGVLFVRSRYALDFDRLTV